MWGSRYQLWPKVARGLTIIQSIIADKVLPCARANQQRATMALAKPAPAARRSRKPMGTSPSAPETIRMADAIEITSRAQNFTAHPSGRCPHIKRTGNIKIPQDARMEATVRSHFGRKAYAKPVQTATITKIPRLILVNTARPASAPSMEIGTVECSDTG